MKSKKANPHQVDAVVMWFHSLFCKHQFKIYSSDRYSVNRMNGTKEGEVILSLFTCSRCGKDLLIPSDRTRLST